MDFEKLLSAAAEGDRNALETLYKMYQPLIIKKSMLRYEFDDDLHQEQMICFWKCIKTFYKNVLKKCYDYEEDKERI